MKPYKRYCTFVCVAMCASLSSGSVRLSQWKHVDGSPLQEEHWNRRYWVTDGRTYNKEHCILGSTAPEDIDLAWIRVDLGFLARINRIIVGNKYKHARNIFGFHLVLSNNTKSLTEGYECFRDKSSKPNYSKHTYEFNCLGTARYVTVYTQQSETGMPAHLALCEIQVFGCPLGLYGSSQNCFNYCACVSEVCDPDNGKCFYGNADPEDMKRKALAVIDPPVPCGG